VAVKRTPVLSVNYFPTRFSGQIRLVIVLDAVVHENIEVEIVLFGACLTLEPEKLDRENEHHVLETEQAKNNWRLQCLAVKFQVGLMELGHLL